MVIDNGKRTSIESKSNHLALVVCGDSLSLFPNEDVACGITSDHLYTVIFGTARTQWIAIN